MKLVSTQQMRDAEDATINIYGISSLSLMEKAGTALANFIIEKFHPGRGAISILVGKGNNGGDGLVAARLLIEKGYEVFVFLTSQTAELSPDARVNWERLAPLTPTFFRIGSDAELKAHYLTFARSTCIVDALLGTGLKSEVKGLLKEIISFINTLKIPVISADIPSGLCADTGMPLGVAINARWTITFGLPKIGLFSGKSLEYTQSVEVADIGIPKEVIDKIETKTHLIEPELFKDYFAKRPLTSHKGLFGHVLIIAGSQGKIGAGWLASMGALRSGCGLVTYALPDHSFLKFDLRYPEVMAVSIPDKGRGHLHPDGIATALELARERSVAAIGPAIGTHEDTKVFVTEFVKRASVPIVIDADAINLLAENCSVLSHRTQATVITPHPKEMARLMKTDAVKKEEERLPSALKFAVLYKVYVVFKGYRTIVATPAGEAYINPTGNPAMATAGMGDALTGMIAGFIAQGMPVDKSAIAAVYCHGLAGDMAAKEYGDRGIVASDVIKCFPEAMSQIIHKDA